MYHETSLDILNHISSEDVKKHDIRFTHPHTIRKMVQTLQDLSFQPASILEPSCGSGEFIRVLRKEFPHSSICGLETHPYVYNEVNSTFNGDVTILQEDFLCHQEKYDLIIGQPPFVVIPKSSVYKPYLSMIEGKPNLYILFLLHALECLNVDGVMAFVLPNAFLSSQQLAMLRDVLAQSYTVLQVQDITEKIDLHKRFVFMLRKEKPVDNTRFTLQIHNSIVLSNETNIKKLRQLCSRMTLNNMFMDVKVGSIAWNKHKDCLTDDYTKTQLIYSKHLKNHSIVRVPNQNPEKKLYIDRPGMTQPVIVIHRGTGKEKLQLDFCLIDQCEPFLIENHLMYICDKPSVPRDVSLTKLHRILQSLHNIKTAQFVDMYFSTNAINATELKYILPIYT